MNPSSSHGTTGTQKTAVRTAAAARLLKVQLQSDHDVVAARQRARHIAELLGFDNQDQVRIATAVSEIARNAFRYARGGVVEFFFDPPSILQIEISDNGDGIANLQEILDGHYQSSTGMGMGLIGTARLVDLCEIDTAAGHGTRVVLRKVLPAGAPAPDPQRFAQLAGALSAQFPVDAFAEVQRQNQELLQTLADLRGRQEELLNLTRELEDTNRGVVALYAEVDEKADHLRRADAMKSRFLSNMSHEFRTPLGSIRALSQLLLDRVDGELGEEQEKQVRFIQKAAEDLSELVNDLLDLAKIEAGRVELRPELFSVEEMFSALRGMLRPLLVSAELELSFEVEPGITSMYADERKISQILRNFISNAIKFTETGRIEVSARREPGSERVRLSVLDTGIGIASEDLQVIFEEFSQVENPLQRRAKGTGLGLPLCRKLANLLGGYVEVQSAPGVGSTFSAVLPLQLAPVISAPELPRPEKLAGTIPVLVIEDHQPTWLLYEKYLQNTPYRPFCAKTLEEAEMLRLHIRPRAVVLDIRLNGYESWPWLERIKSDPATRSLPVIMVSELAEKQRGLALGADRYYMKPLLRADLLGALDQLVAAQTRAIVEENDKMSEHAPAPVHNPVTREERADHH